MSNHDHVETYDGDGNLRHSNTPDLEPREVAAGEVLKTPVYADNTNAVQENRSIWYNDGSGPNPEGFYGYDNGSIRQLGGKDTRAGPNPYDAAETFNESGLTLTHSQTLVNNGSVQIDQYTEGSTIGGNAAASESGLTGEYGWVVNPNTALDGLKVETGNFNSGHVNAYLRNHSDGSLITSKDISNLGADETFVFEAALSSGTDYRITFDGGGGSWDVSRDGTVTPTSSDIDGVTGWYGGSTDSTYRYAIDTVTALTSTDNNSGQVTIEWSYPNDIYEWDVATFTRSPDGETVDVFVAYSDDGGSTWSRTNGGNPIGRNYSLADDSNISASSEVRFEVELSRTDSNNNPTLDSAHRSWYV